MRLVFPHIDVHRGQVALRHVGRVGDDDVERSRKDFGQIAQGVGLVQDDPGAERPAVAGGGFQRRVGDVRRIYLRAGQRQREGGRDAAASGAYIEKGGGRRFGLRDPCRQLFGFGPGNQHPFVHGERAAAELRASHDVLYRTACGQLAEDVVQLRDFERRAGIGQQGRRAQPRQLRDGDEGDAPCFTRPVEGRETCRNAAEYVAARGHQRMKLASAIATAASTTTAPRRATQMSWRPRIISGSTLFVARL